MKVYFINLDRVPERAEFMFHQLAQAGIPNPIRFSAIDAARNPKAEGYKPQSWGPYWTLKPSEVAVVESHRAIWAKVAASDAPAAIFEDDVYLSRTTGLVLASLASCGAGFDMVKLDAVGKPIRLGPDRVLDGQALRPLLEVVPSAAGYLVSPQGATQLLQRSRTYCTHLDDFITQPEPGYSALQLMNAIAIQGMFADLSGWPGPHKLVETSERTTGRNRAEPYARGPALYRLKKELGCASRKISRRLVTDRALRRRGGKIGFVDLAPDLPPYRQ